MNTLSIKSPISFDQKLSELASNIRFLQDVKINSTIYLSDKHFITPLAVAPLVKVINERNIHVQNLDNYCDLVKFPKCLTKIEELQSYNSTYLPIFHFKLDENFDKLDEIISIYVNLVRLNLKSSTKFTNNLTHSTLASLFGELADNITQHSQAKNVFIFGQYYPNMNCFEFCLFDDGRGIYNSLKEAGRDVTSELDAVQKVIDDHLSSKEVEGEERRGTGIKNTRKLINNEQIKGDFIIVSNDIAYIESNSAKQIQQYYKLTNTTLVGTITACRLYEPNEKVEWFNYVTN